MLAGSSHIFRPAARRALVSGACAVVGAVAITIVAPLVAHEGHDTAPQRPVYRQVQAGGESFRVGLALLPQDPVVGEDVRMAVHVRRQDDAAAPLDLKDLQIRVVPAGGTPIPVSYVSPGDRPGTASAVHRFDDDGQYAIALELPESGGSIRADYPVIVRSGPVVGATMIADGVVLLILGAVLVARARRRPEDGAAPSLDAYVVPVAAAVLVLVAVHLWVGPRIGRLFLPERHFGPIAWDVPAGTPGTPTDVPADHTHPPGTPPHSHGEPGGAADADPATTAGEVPSVVVPVPGQLVDVVVPFSARVVFDEFVPRPGRAVRRGQTLATLEHHYILHDAVHLVNQRWPYMLDVFRRKREHLAVQLEVVRLKHLQATGEPAVREMMTVTQAVPTAETKVTEAALELAKAEKLLALHDAQIAKSDLVRRPVTSPIAGTIDAVHFTQGELKYENDRLLTVLDLSRVWIEARFPEQEASRPPPRVMTFSSPVFADRRFQGKLARVSKTLDPATRTVSAFYEIENPQKLLRMGMRLAGRTGGESPSARATAGAVPASLKDPSLPPVALTGTVTAAPELTADLTAPLWGRIEFAKQRLNPGDQVRKGDALVHVVLELSADERYPMESRALDIAAEHELSKARRTQAEQQYQEALETLKAEPGNQFRQQEVAATERIQLAARQEEILLSRQVEAYKTTMKRRDPKTTIIEAPISGVIADVGFRPGELNKVGEFRKLLSIVDTSRVLLDVPVYAHQLPALLGSMSGATFTSPGLDAPRPLKAPIAISGAIDPATGAMRALFETSNPGGALKIGASVQIVIPRN